MPCKIEACGQKHRSRGFCNMHYQRWLKYGDPLVVKLEKRPGALCSIKGCCRKHYSRGWCSSHYQQWLVHGDPLTMKRAANGAGSTDSRGAFRINGRLEHVRIAEQALGRQLPNGAQVHHADGNPSNNKPSNLVICPDNEYHALLHVRMRAMNATGNPNLRRCKYCHNWDEPGALVKLKTGETYWHQKCNVERNRNWRAKQSIQYKGVQA